MLTWKGVKNMKIEIKKLSELTEEEKKSIKGGYEYTFKTYTAETDAI